MNKHSLHALLTLALLVAVGYLGYLVYQKEYIAKQTPPAPPASGLLKTESEFRDKLTELKMDRDRTQRSIDRLRQRKSETIDYLKSKGIRSGVDFQKSNSSDVKYAVSNLKEWADQIARLEKQVSVYNDGIHSIEVMLDRLERKRIDEEVALSEAESFDLQKIILDLNERLKTDVDPLEAEELGKLIDSEMGENQ